MPRSEEDNEQIRALRRSEILAAATRVFVDKGLARAKVTDIAAAANLSSGLLYHYFPSKEAVFEAIAIEMITRVEGELRSEELRAVDRLVHMLLGRLALLESKGLDASRVIMQAVLQGEVLSEGSRQVLSEHLQRLRHVTTELLAQAQREGDLDDGASAEELTRVMLFLFRGMSVSLPMFAVPLPSVETLLAVLRLTPAGMRRAKRVLQVERKKAAAV